MERIGRHMSGVLVGAFSLSVVHTVYAWVEGIEDPTFTVDTPLAWGFYVVAFAMAALARRSQRWAQLVVLAYLVVVLGIALFYYPTTFGPEQQTVFGWFENGVYVGLLFVAVVPRGGAAAADDAHAGVNRSSGWSAGPSQWKLRRWAAA